ncbi:MAG TPA: hypothetical protein VGX91_07635 [Candidatus Cybelea sp.]|jgi:hypothetical protein|nr:hypothetical protein [Candidatus Cybelea sp.]
MIEAFMVHAALAEEEDDGWVWLDSTFPTRTVVKVERKHEGRALTVYCQSRKLDHNYVRRYNSADTNKIDTANWPHVMVMNEWYRDKLGSLKTMQTVELRVTATSKAWRWLWNLRAVIEHPNIVARIGAKLGILGAVLGVLGAVLGIISIRLGILALAK